MSTIKASCPICGDVTLSVRDVKLVINSVPDRSYYAFDCHGERVVKPAGPEVVSKLKHTGVTLEHVIVPAEALEERLGPALTPDDVLDFMNSLDALDAEAA